MMSLLQELIQQEVVIPVPGEGGLGFYSNILSKKLQKFWLSFKPEIVEQIHLLQKK